MQEDGVFMEEQIYDEETEALRKMGTYPINTATYTNIEHLVKLLN